jgi:hypothetical protein
MSGSNGRIRRKGPYTCGKDCLPLPGDEQVGQYSRQQLIRMDSDFVAAMERAIARGFERSPQQDERAA